MLLFTLFSRNISTSLLACALITLQLNPLLRADVVVPAEVTVENLRPRAVDLPTDWRDAPSWLAGAQVFDQLKAGTKKEPRVAHIRGLEKGIILVAASWTYTGNPTHDQIKQRVMPEQMIQLGFTPIGRMMNIKNGVTERRYVIFRRTIDQGEGFRLTTLQSTFPYVFIPDASQIASIMSAQPLINSLGKLKPVPPSAAPISGTGKNNPGPKVAGNAGEVVNNAVIDVNNRTEVPLGTVMKWTLPKFLNGATAFVKPIKRNGYGHIEFEVKQSGMMLLAMTWANDGNDYGDWKGSSCDLRQVMEDGWSPFSFMSSTVGKKKEQYKIFRRYVNAGEKYLFHTRKSRTPIAIFPSNENVASIATIPPHKLTHIDLSTIPFREKLSIGNDPSGRKIVMLTTHENKATPSTNLQGHLLRELPRQALLIAARDELGLSTLDESLGQDFPNASGSTNFPLGVMTEVKKEKYIGISVFRHQMGKPPQVLWSHESVLPKEKMYEALTTKLDAFSRKELKEALAKAGFKGTANHWVASGAVEPEVETLLTQMTFVSQYQAARKIHKQIRAEGESPERLGSLVRAYSNLYLLTNYYWKPIGKAFAARAMLYAERLQSKVPNTTSAYWHRGYARTLIGRHHTGLDDFNKAGTQATAGTIPGWAAAAQAYANYDQKELYEIADGNENRSLAKLLLLIQASKSNSNIQLIARTNSLLSETPDCYYAINSISSRKNDEAVKKSIQLYSDAIREHLYPRLHSFPDLPESVQAITQVQLITEIDELRTRAQLIRELRKTTPLSDPHELDWQVLAEIIEQLTMVQAWNHVSFNRYQLQEDSDQLIQRYVQVIPFITNRVFLQTAADSTQQGQQVIAKIKKDLDSFPITKGFVQLFRYPQSLSNRLISPIRSVSVSKKDNIDYDLSTMIRGNENNSFELIKVTPHSPPVMYLLVKNNWTKYRSQGTSIKEKYFDSYLVLSALYPKFFADINFEQGNACAYQMIRFAPHYYTYQQIGNQLKAQHRYDDWINLWNHYLKKIPDTNLRHARVNNEIAFHLTQLRKWKEATPYAEKSAASHAEWGLRVGGFCAEANQEWDKAETYYRNASQSYNFSSALWYIYCVRTGKGNVDEARKIAFDQSFKKNALPLGTVYYLDEDPEIALDYFIESTEKKEPGYDYALWLTFITAEELEETQKRDDALDAIIKLSEPKPDQSPYNYYLPLAKWLKKDLANGHKAETDRKKLDEIDKLVPRGNSPVFHYTIGKYLDLHGKSKEAEEYMLESMSCPFMFDNIRTLAGQWLVNKKIGPDAYYERLHTEIK